MLITVPITFEDIYDRETKVFRVIPGAKELVLVEVARVKFNSRKNATRLYPKGNYFLKLNELKRIEEFIESRLK